MVLLAQDSAGADATNDAATPFGAFQDSTNARLNRSMKFDGSNDYLQASYSTDMDLGQDFAWSTWLAYNGTTGTLWRHNGHKVEIVANKVVVTLIDPTGPTRTLTSTRTLATGVPVHVGVYARQATTSWTISIWFNASKESETSPTTTGGATWQTFTLSSFYLGAGNSASGPFLNGWMDDFVLDRAGTNTATYFQSVMNRTGTWRSAADAIVYEFDEIDANAPGDFPSATVSPTSIDEAAPHERWLVVRASADATKIRMDVNSDDVWDLETGGRSLAEKISWTTPGKSWLHIEVVGNNSLSTHYEVPVTIRNAAFGPLGDPTTKNVECGRLCSNPAAYDPSDASMHDASKAFDFKPRDFWQWFLMAILVVVACVALWLRYINGGSVP